MNLDFDNRWIPALAMLFGGALVLTTVGGFLKSRIAIYGTDRAERSNDSWNYWAIIAWLACGGLLFAAVGGWVVTPLIIDRVPVPWWLLLTLVWAIAILASHRVAWGRQALASSRFGKMATIFWSVSQAIVALGLIACLITGVASRQSPWSRTPIATQMVPIEKGGTWYVAPRTAALFKTSTSLLVLIMLPGFAAGFSNGWLSYRTRRIKRDGR